MDEMKTLMSILPADMTDLKTLEQEVHDLKESLQFHEGTVGEMHIHERGNEGRVGIPSQSGC